MKNKKYILEIELEKACKKLEREKVKRNIIMGLICSAFVYWIFSSTRIINLFADNGILDLVGNFAGAIFCGFILYFSGIGVFVFVTQIFTNINALESEVKCLEEELKKE